VCSSSPAESHKTTIEHTVLMAKNFGARSGLELPVPPPNVQPDVDGTDLAGPLIAA